MQDSNDVTITDERDPDSLSQNGSISGGGVSGGSGGERGIDVGRVGAWATDFEKLLKDPLGLQTFTVIAKKTILFDSYLRIELKEMTSHLCALNCAWRIGIDFLFAFYKTN